MAAAFGGGSSSPQQGGARQELGDAGGIADLVQGARTYQAAPNLLRLACKMKSYLRRCLKISAIPVLTIGLWGKAPYQQPWMHFVIT
ncbi:hypothetical protein OsI_16153 [Oryza sativa Indica Group]|uniref:Uncharacterized protein n=1 Tax=Oryza sativa subsp. indica TaxID=39946 RepID=B8AUQ1_ORYSI|nr:hypothetical protein OsI_16153 [Oryza sativa Indica Group]